MSVDNAHGIFGLLPCFGLFLQCAIHLHLGNERFELLFRHGYEVFAPVTATVGSTHWPKRQSQYPRSVVFVSIQMNIAAPIGRLPSLRACAFGFQQYSASSSGGSISVLSHLLLCPLFQLLSRRIDVIKISGMMQPLATAASGQVRRSCDGVPGATRTGHP